MIRPFFAEIINEHNVETSKTGWKSIYAHAGGKIAASIDAYKNIDEEEVIWVGVKGNRETNAPADINLFCIVNGKIIVNWNKMKEKVDKWNEEINKFSICREVK